MTNRQREIWREKKAAFSVTTTCCLLMPSTRIWWAKLHDIVLWLRWFDAIKQEPDGKKVAVAASEVVQACCVITLFSRLHSRYLMAGAFSFCQKGKKFSCDYFTFCYAFSCFPLIFFFLSLCFSSPLFLSLTVFSVLC